jgi:hypothetical protein
MTLKKMMKGLKRLGIFLLFDHDVFWNMGHRQKSDPFKNYYPLFYLFFVIFIKYIKKKRRKKKIENEKK